MVKTKKSTNKRKRSHTISNTKRLKQSNLKESNLKESNLKQSNDNIDCNSDKSDDNENSVLKNLFDKFITLFQ